MHIINVDRITINHAGRVIFRDLSWAVGDRDRAGLIGPNGAGKSSLLKAIAGQLQPDRGAVTRMTGIRVGCLPQEVQLTPRRSLIDEAMALPPQRAEREAELARLEARLGLPEVCGDADAVARALARQEQVLQQFEALGGRQHASKVRDLLAQLGFTPADYDLLTDTLSGGQKK